ncbi:F-box protein skip19 [Thalictrum thalictroides]|uniref:F-box protein skip19 n=1 Tax=Thalictrum thalictroides TaxID=46969 RepID=A0A7J6VTH6_THATH|nr:F-box protein skip19 [Thalictrum thalictroides]
MGKRRNNAFDHQLTKSKLRQTRKKEVRNWLDLPREIMILIFMKLGQVDIILIAQNVCSSWRKLANEPQLYRTITVQYQDFLRYFDFKPLSSGKFAMLFKEAFRRSCGQLVGISCETLLDQDLLNYVVGKPNSLKTLKIGMDVCISVVGFILIVKRLPLLEELDLLIGYYTNDLFKVIGLSCQKLRHLRVDYRNTPCSKMECERQAFAIARSMTHLHSLHLIGSKMSNKGLQAILAGCPNLEYLDLRCCFKITLEGDVPKELIGRIRKIEQQVSNLHVLMTFTCRPAQASNDQVLRQSER